MEIIREEYRTIPWAKKYKVSNTGKVYSFAKIKLGIELVPHSQPDKRKGTGSLYPYVSISDNDKKIRNYNIHRLVAETFIPNPENKPQVNHIDGNKQNNFVTNLEWVTPKENTQHAVKEGLMNPPIGERSGSSRHKESQVLEVIRLLADGKPNHEVAKLTGINDRAVSDIRNKRRWGYLWETDQTKGLAIPDSDNGQFKSKIPLETRIEIIKDAEYLAPKDLIKKYGLSSSAASRIKHGECWKDARDIVNNTQ